ncbi:hypothetical protein CEXT_186201 [Caerostris extrusa]|uniref:Uncharacterized protein n=1 Tax=Caerostris extrusa TaxID=172846 RepID=A0AAV4TVN5_CAEEX|nr:hypothetical protein CEXT_186201 [Caerostris extrusa]
MQIYRCRLGAYRCKSPESDQSRAGAEAVYNRYQISREGVRPPERTYSSMCVSRGRGMFTKWPGTVDVNRGLETEPACTLTELLICQPKVGQK